ncbi:unnamed protein product [Nesidiocoris tenuis]|uniref:Uncharacterized protein n=1 Tax=Nesidiocoris tenuis TaxID=355587 RepID=A0A6H5HIC3_9HEMI|nr:unnamed protein product [Nesidiocoris tenuis]
MQVQSIRTLQGCLDQPFADQALTSAVSWPTPSKATKSRSIQIQKANDRWPGSKSRATCSHCPRNWNARRRQPGGRRNVRFANIFEKIPPKKKMIG